MFWGGDTMDFALGLLVVIVLAAIVITMFPAFAALCAVLGGVGLMLAMSGFFN